MVRMQVTNELLVKVRSAARSQIMKMYPCMTYYQAEQFTDDVVSEITLRLSELSENAHVGRYVRKYLAYNAPGIITNIKRGDRSDYLLYKRWREKTGFDTLSSKEAYESFREAYHRQHPSRYVPKTSTIIKHFVTGWNCYHYALNEGIIYDETTGIDRQAHQSSTASCG